MLFPPLALFLVLASPPSITATFSAVQYANFTNQPDYSYRFFFSVAMDGDLVVVGISPCSSYATIQSTLTDSAMVFRFLYPTARLPRTRFLTGSQGLGMLLAFQFRMGSWYLGLRVEVAILSTTAPLLLALKSADPPCRWRNLTAGPFNFLRRLGGGYFF